MNGYAREERPRPPLLKAGGLEVFVEVLSLSGPLSGLCSSRKPKSLLNSGDIGKSYRPFSLRLSMAFRFGFANDDEEDINADDGKAQPPTPNASEGNIPPVKEHSLKDMVGQHFPVLTSTWR